VCPKTGKQRELYVHVFNTEQDEEPVISTRKRFRPEANREAFLTDTFTQAAVEALKRDGDDILVKYVAEKGGDQVLWAAGTLPVFPVGGDVFVYGNPSVPRSKKPAGAEQPKAPVAAPKPVSRIEEIKKRTAALEANRKFGEAARQYDDVIKNASALESIELRRELAAMWLERAKLPQRAVPILRKLKEETEDSNPGEYARVIVGLGKTLFKLGKHSEAAEELMGALKYMNENRVSASEEVQKDIKLHLGAALFSGGRQEGIKIIQDTLAGDVSNTFGVMYMSKAYAALGHPDDALQWAVTLVVRDQKNEELKRNFADVAGAIPDAVERIAKNVLNKGGVDMASAWGFLGLIARDNGHLRLAQQLYAQAMTVMPAHTNLMLNYAHIFEQQGDARGSLAAIVEFFRRNPTISIDGVARLGDKLPLLERALAAVEEGATTFAMHREVVRVDSEDESVKVLEPTEENWAVPAGVSSGWEEPKATRKDGVAKGRRMLNDGELSTAGLYFTAVKVLFVLGRLDVIPPIIEAVEEFRWFEKFSRTMMKNEHAYYTTITLAMQHMNGPAVPDPRPLLGDGNPTEGKLYVCADSHSMPMSWQQVTIDGVPTVTVNRLVTGLKIWHMRPESNFFPKRNFEGVVASIPEGADALFCFGEIDCREGVIAAVEKGAYDSPQEAMLMLIDIYVSTLLRVKAQRKLRRVFVLAPLAILNVTRHIVAAFSQVFDAAAPQMRAKGLIPINTTDDILTLPTEASADKPHDVPKSMGELRVLRPELQLDHTHIHPCFVPQVLAPAINAALTQ